MDYDMSVAVSVVCPFFNEEAIIAAAARRIIGNMQDQFSDWELIFVDDGSTDNSLDVLTETIKAVGEERVKVISYPMNQGRGRALKTGIDAACGDIIVTTEADCSWGDDIALRLVRELENNQDADFIIASPHLPGGGLVNVPPFRRFLTKFGNKLIHLFFVPGITMNTGMTRAYRRHVVQPLVTGENGKEFHLEVLLKLITIGFKAREIPATITWQKNLSSTQGRGSGRKSSTKLQKTIGTHLRFLAVSQPMRYFAYLSGFSLLSGLGLLAAAVWMVIIKETAVFLALLGMMMLIICLIFTGFSVIFILLRESLREQWLHYYPKPWPPSAHHGHVTYPADAKKK